jgi:hypothetical protein
MKFKPNLKNLFVSYPYPQKHTTHSWKVRDKKEWIKISAVLFFITAFILFKLSNLDFRFGDGNAYIYMAYEILGGSIPYKDFFLADPPVFVLILTFFKVFFGNHLLLFQILPIFAESLTALFLYLLLKKLSNPYAFLAPAFYLFSFSILATSNFFTGVQFVVLFVVSAMLLYEYDKRAASGVFWALACLSKLYAVPAFVGFAAYLIFKKEPVQKMLIGFFGASFAITIPFIIVSPRNFFDYTFFHHLRRPYGISKLSTLSLYASKEWMILILGFIGFFLAKKKSIAVSFALSALFLLAFKDLYYLYLNILLPFLIISVFYFIEKIGSPANGNKTAFWIFIAIYCAFAAQSVLTYQKEYKDQGKFPNTKEITEYIKTLPEGVELYGGHEIAPVMALMADRKLFENMIDTNTQVFSAKTIDVKKLSERAVEKGIYLIAKTDDYPEYKIYDFGFEGFFDKDVFKNSCSEIKRFPVFYDMDGSETSRSKIGVYLCKNK